MIAARNLTSSGLVIAQSRRSSRTRRISPLIINHRLRMPEMAPPRKGAEVGAIGMHGTTQQSQPRSASDRPSLPGQ
jgi:hypothetical protein